MKSKRVLAAMLGLSMAFCLFACTPQVNGDNESSSAESELPQESDSVTVESNGYEDTSLEGELSETAESFDSVEGDATEGSTESREATELEIFENGGIASVKTTEGLEYEVSGYDSIVRGGLVFAKDMSLKFSEPFAASFNRFSLKYSSTKAVKIFIGYTLDGAAKEDYYFLESGSGTFSGLIPDFLNGKQGSEITGFRVENLEGGEATFAACGFETEVADVPDRNYYIRGSRYTLGIDLGWGGTINYVSDKQCPISGVENMINKHDTGRLVQQSYYGTGEQEGIDFVWGSFNGSDKWPYNPVQGGCQGNLASRLIDFSVEGNTVYIKVQPMDWGKNGKTMTVDQCITPSYMENRYIIEDEYIRVENRFVDFSGWVHGCKSQELPAFYTISYLDSFVWYDGADPWTGDDLSWRHELRFWGDSQYAGECSFRIKVPNTETWCAWVSTEDNYGIGLYSPNIDRYSAGRYQYIETLGVSTGTSGSKDASANPTNYVAPWKQVEFFSFKPLEYSYLICAGSVDEIRSTFTEYKDIIDNASLSENSVSNRRPNYEENMESIDFTVEGNEKFAAYPNATDIIYDKDMQALKLTVTGSDPHVSFDYSASAHLLFAKDYEYIEIEYMIPATNSLTGYSCQLFICAGDRTSPAESDSVRPGLIKDGEFHTLRVKLSDKDYWTGRVNEIRLDYFNGSSVGDVIYIRSVKLSNIEISGLEKIDFTSNEGMSLVAAMKATSYVYDEALKATKLTVTGNDPSITIDYSILSTPMQASDYSKLRITYMVPEGQSTSNFSYCIFPCTGEVTSPTGSAQIYKSTGIIADGQYHTLELDLSQYAFWSGQINKIRIDYFNSCVTGDVFYIASVELVK